MFCSCSTQTVKINFSIFIWNTEMYLFLKSIKRYVNGAVYVVLFELVFPPNVDQNRAREKLRLTVLIQEIEKCAEWADIAKRDEKEKRTFLLFPRFESFHSERSYSGGIVKFKNFLFVSNFFRFLVTSAVFGCYFDTRMSCYVFRSLMSLFISENVMKICIVFNKMWKIAEPDVTLDVSFIFDL